ncbi:MAG: glycerol-3-phosphate 1-O-acyltransferase [Actinomycetota bacterium]
MSLRAVPGDAEAPWPDAGKRPVCFVVDGAGGLEARLVDEWIERRRPSGTECRVVRIPSSRRRRARGSLDDLRAALGSSSDLLLVPARVAWTTMRRRGRRVPSLIDLITLGDPRDPNRLLQELIVRFRPDWVRVIAGEPATVAAVRSRWLSHRVERPAAPTGFAEYVALQAALTLEVAERRVRGNRYKVPRFVAEDLLTSASYQAGLADLARVTGDDVESLGAKTAAYLKEIAASPSTFVIDLVAALVRAVYTMGYERRIRYDPGALDRIATIGQSHSVAFLPAHKSNMDHLALTYVLYENGLPPNLTAGGINMNFFPIGPLLRRHGIFFIRRTFKDDEPYKFVLKRYIDYLLSKRFPLEWYLEGGRSRSGKLREPRYGMLSYVADSWRRGSCDDVVLIPTSIAYDQIQDVSAHAAEQRGERKERESFAWLVKVVRSLRRRYGRINLAFGEPVQLSQFLERYPAGTEPDPDASNVEIAKLAFEVSVRINRVSPVTPISLVTVALLGAERALTVGEVHEVVRELISFVEARSLPVTERLDIDDLTQVRAALDALVDHRVATRLEGGTETVYAVRPRQELAAAYYRNTIVHFFVTGAIAEVALVAADGTSDPEPAFWEEVWAMRDLAKFEFFFAEREEFRAEVAAEVAFHDPDWIRLVATAPVEVLGRFHPVSAPWVLRPIFEAYLVVADALVAADFRRDADPKALTKSCLALGEQYRAQRRIRSAEAVSTVLFESAIRLADNRGLLGGGDVDRLREREALAAEIRGALERIERIASLRADGR